MSWHPPPKISNCILEAGMKKDNSSHNLSTKYHYCLFAAKIFDVFANNPLLPKRNKRTQERFASNAITAVIPSLISDIEK